LLNINDLEKTGTVLGHPGEIMTGEMRVEECRITQTEMNGKETVEAM
jgi:hypothetical protein